MKLARILVVDDDALNRSVIGHMLRLSGFAPSLAADGEEALEAIVAGQFDAVVTDVNMPRMCGLDLLKRVQGRFPWLPVIVMTGLATEEVQEAARAGGAIAVFQKPVMRNDLMAAVACGLRRGAEEALESSRFTLANPTLRTAQPGPYGLSEVLAERSCVSSFS